MNTVLPTLVGQADGASSHGTTRSTIGDRSHPPGQQLQDVRDRGPGADASGREAHASGPTEPIATESVDAGPPVRAASARAFSGWCSAIDDRLHADGWPANDAESVAVAVISLIDGALILSRVTGDTAPLVAAEQRHVAYSTASSRSPVGLSWSDGAPHDSR